MNTVAVVKYVDVMVDIFQVKIVVANAIYLIDIALLFSCVIKK